MIRFVAVAAMVGLCSTPVHAQQTSDSRPKEEQTLFFRAVLRELGAKSVTDFTALSQSPETKVLIVLGPTNTLDALIRGGRLSRFLAAGGTVMIATDRATSRNVSSQIGAVIDGRHFAGQPADSYRGALVGCPRLHEVRRQLRPNEMHPIFRDLPPDAVVATNLPSLLSDWSRLASYRPIAAIDAPEADGLRTPLVDGYRVLGVLGEFPRGGRLLVLADHSIFIDMMVQPDNHNLDFTFGVLRWLTDEGKRTEVLLIDNDAIQPDFNVSLVRPPMPPMPSIQQLIPILSQWVSAQQKEDILNKMIQRSVPHSTFMRSTALIFTMMLLAFGTYRFLQTRHRFDPRPKPTAIPASAEPVAGQYVQSARELATDVFREFGQAVQPRSSAPSYAVRGRFGERRKWRSHIERLWLIAGGDAVADSAAALQQVHVDRLALRAAAQAGVVQFATSQ